MRTIITTLSLALSLLVGATELHFEAGQKAHHQIIQTMHLSADIDTEKFELDSLSEMEIDLEILNVSDDGYDVAFLIQSLTFSEDGCDFTEQAQPLLNKTFVYTINDTLEITRHDPVFMDLCEALEDETLTFSCWNIDFIFKQLFHKVDGDLQKGKSYKTSLVTLCDLSEEDACKQDKGVYTVFEDEDNQIAANLKGVVHSESEEEKVIMTFSGAVRWNASNPLDQKRSTQLNAFYKSKIENDRFNIKIHQEWY